MIELSIIIPTHGGRTRELVRCLESVKNCNLRSYQIILVSDVHDQEISAVAEQYLGGKDYFIVRNGKPGPAESRNLALELVEGSRVLLLDDDDALPETGYQSFVDFALANPDKAVYGDVVIIKEDRKKGVLLPDPPERMPSTTYEFQSIYVKNFIYTPACLYPSHLIRGIKQDTHMRSFEDWEFVLSVISRVEFKPLDQVVAIVYKDYINVGNRRSTTEAARNFELVLDYLYVYRRWPAPTLDLKKKREDMLKSVGLDISAQFL
ncbi:glycosyltransferase family 2 protein [Magnetovirga frankeli]|uniref:glycosyltransferase family A protein n=1 Tax=Magnetovirga frankeli TaxID=947516 RepID=UPI0012938D95|nr:glycosyltransferase family 2 protein [gamma proteobacterium SS-5]